MDLNILLEAPRREDLRTRPRLAANAAPAAICCFFDFAGIRKPRIPRLKMQRGLTPWNASYNLFIAAAKAL